MPRNIDIALLRTFVAVAELGQITKAAQRVNLSQSAASQQITRLEEQLGVSLLLRSANRIRLSPEGEQLYNSAAQMLMLNDSIMREMRASRTALEVRLGVPHDLVERFSPPVLKRFGESHPHVSVKLVSLPTCELRRLLHMGEVDLTLVTELHGFDEGEKLMTDRLVWVGAKGAVAPRSNPLVVALGGDGDRFTEPTTEALNKCGTNWRKVQQIGSLGSVLAMLAADMAVAPFLSRTVPHFLSILEGENLPSLPEFSINLLQSSQAQLPEHQVLADHIRDFFQDLDNKNECPTH